MWRHFMWPRFGKKNSKLEKKYLSESPFTEMTYRVRGCMTFTLNELDSAMSMAYFVRTRPYQTRAWLLGWRGTPWRLIFVSYHEKCLFHFRSTEIGFFCEAATETRNRKLGKTPHINSRPPGIRISTLVLLRQPSEVFLKFVQVSADFVGTGVILHFSAKK
jgi:hypothetical protein